MPDEKGYYLCKVRISKIGTKSTYAARILYWEDNVWIDSPYSFYTYKNEDIKSYMLIPKSYFETVTE